MRLFYRPKAARKKLSANGRRRRAWRRLALVLAAALALAVCLGWVWVHDRPLGNPARVRLTVPHGTDLESLVAIFEDSGLTTQPLALGYVLRFKGTMGGLKAGTYEIPGDANALELADALARGTVDPAAGAITLIPGESIWQHEARLVSRGLATPGELATLAADYTYIKDTLHLPVGDRRAPRPDGIGQTYLEGFIYPDTYFVDAKSDLRTVIRRATRRFTKVWGGLEKAWRSDLLAIQQRHGLSTLELITLASLVEEEVQHAAEAPRVAGVFYNRLLKGMRLQTDPTLMYRPDRVGKAPSPTERRDGSNPYNTYAHAGLPPGPIASPGRYALEAVLRPERHDYLYFVSKRDAQGRHAFARTLDEHEANIEKYLR